MNKKFLIIGQGAIGKPLAEALAKCYSVSAVARSKKQYTSAVHFIQKDARTLTADDVKHTTHMAIIVTPSANPDRAQAYQDSYLAICQHLVQLAESAKEWQPQRMVFLSSTAVYGENHGEIIDENTPANPTSDTARILLAAENALTQAFADKVVIVRASGIYGVTRTHLVRQAMAGVAASSAHYTNRIMDSDLIAVLHQILTAQTVKPLYLATDFCPVSSAQVFEYLADLLNLPAPNIHHGAATGKKIISNLDKNWLQFTDYQAGYRWIIAQHRNIIDSKL